MRASARSGAHAPRWPAPQQVDPTKCRALAEAQYHRCQADPKAYVGWFETAVHRTTSSAYAAQTLRPLAEQLVEVCERQFGPEHPETARALTNLARVALMQGDAERGRAAAAPRARHPGAVAAADHPDMALTIAALGGYYSGRGDLRCGRALLPPCAGNPRAGCWAPSIR